MPIKKMFCVDSFSILSNSEVLSLKEYLPSPCRFKANFSLIGKNF